MSKLVQEDKSFLTKICSSCSLSLHFLIELSLSFSIQIRTCLGINCESYRGIVHGFGIVEGTFFRHKSDACTNRRAHKGTIRIIYVGYVGESSRGTNLILHGHSFMCVNIALGLKQTQLCRL